jgi:lipopolysaccharide transport system permease protein
VLWTCELVFVCGCALLCGALDVYMRDMRYVVESACTVLFWMVPIFYDLSAVRPQYAELYEFNPIAALVVALRDIILKAKAPRGPLLMKLFLVSFFMFGFGWYAFRRLRHRFYDYL